MGAAVLRTEATKDVGHFEKRFGGCHWSRAGVRREHVSGPLCSIHRVAVSSNAGIEPPPDDTTQDSRSKTSLMRGTLSGGRLE